MLKSTIIGTRTYVGNRHVHIEDFDKDLKVKGCLLCHAGPIMLIKGTSSHMMDTGDSQIHSNTYRIAYQCDTKYVDLYEKSHAYDKFGWAEVFIAFFKESGKRIALSKGSEISHSNEYPLIAEFDTIDYHWKYEFKADGTWTEAKTEIK